MNPRVSQMALETRALGPDNWIGRWVPLELNNPTCHAVLSVLAGPARRVPWNKAAAPRLTLSGRFTASTSIIPAHRAEP
jgi:hypothetical protein